MSDLSKYIQESVLKIFSEDFLEEERISNKEASEFVNNKENFIGSHTYGEDLGDLGKMYVAYSYGEQHPLYLYDSRTDIWYYNYDDYILPDGRVNVWTRRHLKNLRPNEEVIGKPKSFLMLKIRNFKKKHKLGQNKHKSLKPGEK